MRVRPPHRSKSSTSELLSAAQAGAVGLWTKSIIHTWITAHQGFPLVFVPVTSGACPHISSERARYSYFIENVWGGGTESRGRRIWRKEDMQIRLSNPHGPTSIRYQAKVIRSYSRSRGFYWMGRLLAVVSLTLLGCSVTQMLPCWEIEIMQRTFELSSMSELGPAGQSKTSPKPRVWGWIPLNPKKRYYACRPHQNRRFD